MTDPKFETREAVMDAALIRMKRAHDRGTGCYLTPEMIVVLGTSILCEAWESAAHSHLFEGDRT